MLKKRMAALALATALAVAGWIPAGAEEGFDQPYLVQIAEDDPSAPIGVLLPDFCFLA